MDQCSIFLKLLVTSFWTNHRALGRSGFGMLIWNQDKQIGSGQIRNEFISFRQALTQSLFRIWIRTPPPRIRMDIFGIPDPDPHKKLMRIRNTCHNTAPHPIPTIHKMSMSLIRLISFSTTTYCRVGIQSNRPQLTSISPRPWLPHRILGRPLSRPPGTSGPAPRTPPTEHKYSNYTYNTDTV